MQKPYERLLPPAQAHAFRMTPATLFYLVQPCKSWQTTVLWHLRWKEDTRFSSNFIQPVTIFLYGHFTYNIPVLTTHMHILNNSRVAASVSNIHQHPKTILYYADLRFLGQILIFKQSLFQVNFTVKGWISDSLESATQRNCLLPA